MERTSTSQQLRELGIAFSRHGINRREDRLRLMSDHVGRQLYTSGQLTFAEAATLLERLDRLEVGDLPRALARLIRAEENRAREYAQRSRPVGWICTRTGRGRGCTPITEDDWAQAERTGEQLELSDG
jgi:hypothetical protein